MERAAALSILGMHEAELKRRGVQYLYLFGSTARDSSGADSDVDLFFDHPEGSIGLFGLMPVKEAAGRILGRCAEIMTRRRLYPMLRREIQVSAAQVF